ncbi:MAG: hypothetical protein ACLP01_13425 [Solirubrobacteraceae bacterium]
MLLAAAPHAAADSTIKVAGTCTLQDAVAYADGTAEPGCASSTATGVTTIDLPSSTTPYTVSGTTAADGHEVGLMFTAGTDTIISGAGASLSTISGGGSMQVMSITSGATVTLDGVTITGGVSGLPTTGCMQFGLFERTCPASCAAPPHSCGRSD